MSEKVVVNFIYPLHENLPEISIYTKMLERHGIKCFHNKEQLEYIGNNELLHYYEWHIMGTHFIWKNKFTGKVNSKNKFLIHEFASLSTSKYRGISIIKDFLKKILSHKANYYLFLNENIKKRIKPHSINYEYRDMGIANYFKDTLIKNKKYKYDYIYIGSMSSSRQIDKLLKSELIKGKKIILIGDAPDKLKNHFSSNSLIKFIGRIEQHKIPEYINQAETCLNYVPNVFPYNIQTSTKMLEYLAMHKKIISTRYEWVLNFLNKNNIKYKEENNFLYINDIEKYSIVQSWDDIMNNSIIIKKIIDEHN